MNEKDKQESTSQEPTSDNQYEKPEAEQHLRADLEETWQDESPSTARDTDLADEVDGIKNTRHREHDGT